MALDRLGELVQGENQWSQTGAARKLAENLQKTVVKLPTEILSEIFLICRYSLPSSGWMQITQICHRWRQIALQLPRLWNQINLSRPTAGEYHLALTKKTVLHLRTGQGLYFWPSLLDKCLQMMTRVVSINLALHCQSSSPVPPLPACVSPLRSFCVKATTDNNFIGAFKTCKFPDIRELYLAFCLNNIPPCLFGSTLTHLTLCGFPLYPVAESLDFTSFMDTLSRLSNLEYLRLQDVVLAIKDHSLSKSPLPTISLPRLRIFALKSPSTTSSSCDLYLDLLSKVDIPPTTNVYIHFHGEINRQDNPGKFLPILKLLGQLTKRQVCIESTSTLPHPLAIKFWPTRGDSVNTSPIRPASVITLPWGLSDPALMRFFDELPMEDVELLDLKRFVIAADDMREWELLFKRLTSVKDLILGTALVNSFLRGLRKKLDSDITDTVPFMPLLENVYIHAQENTQILPMQSLVDGLLARRSCGYPLNTIYLDGQLRGGIQPEDMDKLETVVTVVFIPEDGPNGRSIT
ncbi:hypothetical protein QCA50_011144 [Cerrena zonata]|uniref:F-box domain-containing protein n=1 Tax=Cerrena zonata TaxID=2478898 RepID=A0AAW0FXL6_9APHY